MWLKMYKALFILMLGVAGAASARDGAHGDMCRQGQSVFFVANEGQWDEPFAFKLNAGGTTYFVTEQGLTIDIRQYDRTANAASGLPPYPMGGLRGEEEPEPVSVRGHVLKLNFVNPVSPHSVGGLRGVDKLPSYSNYFLGRDSCRWRSRVGHYQRVIAENVWQGIDVEFVAVGAVSATGPGIKTNYHVHPGADVSQIQIEYEGLDAPLQVDGSGNLELATSLGDLKEQKPWAYQIDGRQQRDVGVQFAVMNEHRYGVITSSIDASKELVIDPLIYGSYFGGIGPDWGLATTVGRDGSVFASGESESAGLPTTPGAYEDFNPFPGRPTIYTSRFSSDLSTLAYSTYVGAHVTQPSGEAEAFQLFLVVDQASRVWGGGATSAWDWPLTVNAFDTTFDDVYLEGFFYRLSADGSALEYSSFLGGSGSDELTAAAVDSLNYILWLAGNSVLSPDLPVTPNAQFPTPFGGEYDVILGKFNLLALTMDYLSFFGAAGVDLAWCVLPVTAGTVWLAGSSESTGFPTTPTALRSDAVGTDGFVTSWNIADGEFEYSTLLGGAGLDWVNAVAIVDSDHIGVVGVTMSADFPVSADAADTSFHPDEFNGFVTILTPSTGEFRSTYLSGAVRNSSDMVFGACAARDYFSVAGWTSNADFPVSPGAEDTVLNATGGINLADLFLCKLNLDLTLIEYCTYFGGDFDDRLSQSGSVYYVNADTVWLTGATGSTDFPISPNAFQPVNAGLGDAFIAGYAFPPSDAVSERPYPAILSDLNLLVYPNPFNGEAQVLYGLSQSQNANLVIYDLLGRRVQSLNLGWQSAGTHRTSLSFDSRPSGIYTIRLQAGTQAAIQRAVLVR
ncbi:T9SS type A sorting domain-containing protein [candidate division KSB1 bacterium]|nr:T9SS type A sorting domain-containing protein [candidate division KSB1 bacterium]